MGYRKDFPGFYANELSNINIVSLQRFYELIKYDKILYDITF